MKCPHDSKIECAYLEKTDNTIGCGVCSHYKPSASIPELEEGRFFYAVLAVLIIGALAFFTHMLVTYIRP